MKNIETRDVRRLIRYGEIDCVGLGKLASMRKKKHVHTYICIRTHAYVHMKISLALMHALTRDFTS